MSARKSPTFSKPSPPHPSYEVSRAKFRHQDPRDENTGLMRRMEDSSLRLIYDCRLSIWEVPTLIPAAHQHAGQDVPT